MGFGGLSIAVSGLNANQRALDVTAHNIANADNSDYVRQRAIQQDSWYENVGISGNMNNMQIGVGVDSQTVSQIRDQFLDNKYRKEVVKLGYYDEMRKTGETMESLFNEISDNGLAKVTNQFWSKWQEVAKDPQNLATRALLKDSAIAYCETVNHLATGLNQFRADTDATIVSKVKEINEAAKTVAEMNGLIQRYESGGVQNANDYRDTRNKYIDKLANDLGVQITYQSNGMVNVLVNGNAIVNGTTSDEITTTVTNDQYGMGIIHKLTWKSTGADFVPSQNSGAFRALLDTRDQVIVDNKNKLDAMVQKIALDINELHVNGQGIDPNNKTPKLNFFVGSNGVDATGLTSDNISYNSKLIDTNNICAAKSSDNVDGTNAKAIGDLTGKNVYIFKSIVGAKITSSVTITSGQNDKFTVGFRGDKYEITVPNGTYASSNALKTAINGALATISYAKDATKHLSDFVTADSKDGALSISVKDESRDVLYADDKYGALKDMGLSANVKYSDFYNGTVRDIGQLASQAKTIAEGQQVVINQIDDSRKATSGVSKDEEMSNMLQFQHAYNASARVVNAIDEMLDTIINKLGR